LSLDRFSSGNYRTDIYQNSYGPDFRVGYDSYTPESILYLKRLSDGSKEVEINGNVGIGTTSPNQKLEVHGNILLGNNDVNSFIHGGASAAMSADTNILIVADSNDTSGAAPAGNIIFGSGSAVDTNQNRDFTYAQAYPSNVPRNEHMRITGDGYVGIGTTSPSASLHVQGDASIFGNNAGGSGIVINDIPQARWRISTGGYALSFSKHNSTSDEYSAWSEKVRIDSNGNVGIGTTSPVAQLHVASHGPTYTAIGGNDRFRIEELVTNGNKFGLQMGIDWGTGHSSIQTYALSSGGSYSQNYSLLLQPHGGNVGIGLTGPESRLHIYGSDNPLILQSQRSPYPKLSYDFSGVNAENLQFYDHHGSGRGFLYGRKYTTGTNLNPFAGWHFYGNDNTLALRIDGAANVGIGTASPATKLHVDGSLLVGDRLPYGSATHTDAQLILGGSHNSSTDYTTSNQIKLLISGGDNDGASPYYIMCEDENGQDQFWVKGSTSSSTNRCHARINDIGFAAYRSGGGDNSYTSTVVFNNEYYDRGSCYSTSNGKFTAPVAGIYRFGFNAFTNQGATTASRVYLYKNEGIYIQKGNSIDRHGNCIDTLIKLAANDTVSIRGSGSYPVYIYISQAHNIFYGHLITAL
jgi:hypothetical protein